MSDKPTRIIIPAPVAFKDMCRVVATSLTEVTMRARKTEACTGIMINSMDADLICAVNCQFVAKIEGPECSFCVNMPEMNELLKLVPDKGVLTIVCDPASSEIKLICASDGTVGEYFLLNLTHCDESFEMDNVSSSYTVQLGLPQFKGLIDTAHSTAIKAGTVQMGMIEQDGAIFFSMGLHVDDRCVGRKTFPGHMSKDNVLRVASTLPETLPEEMVAVAAGPVEINPGRPVKEMYQQRFPTDYLHKFCSKMDKQDVLSLNLCDNDGATQPVIINMNLGQENSFARLILANRVDDE
jgi:hypothetical protein